MEETRKKVHDALESEEEEEEEMMMMIMVMVTMKEEGENQNRETTNKKRTCDRVNISQVHQYNVCCYVQPLAYRVNYED